MKLKGLVSMLVVFTILTMSLACAAASYSTTVVYDADKAGVKLVTTVTDAVVGNMYTYAVYGNDGGKSVVDGSVAGTTDASITVNAGVTNLKYIDQKTADSSTITFETPVSDIVLGKKVVIGSNDTKNSAQGTAGFTADSSELCYSVKVREAEWAESNLASITLTVTGWGTFTIDEATDVVYLPVGNDVKVTFDPKTDYILHEGGYQLGSHILGVSSAVSNDTVEVNAEVAQELFFSLPACISKTETKFVTLGKTVLQDGTFTWFMTNNIDDATVGIDAFITNTVTGATTTVTDLDLVDGDGNASTGLCGIELVDNTTEGLFDFEAVGEGYKATASINPYCRIDGAKVTLTHAGNNDYYLAQ